MPGSDMETGWFCKKHLLDRGGGYSSMQEPLPTMYEAISSILNSTMRRKETPGCLLEWLH